MQEFLAELSSLGFNPPAVKLDGQLMRFDRNGKGNAWLIGFQNHSIKTGKVYVVAKVGDWKTGEEHVIKPSKLAAEDKGPVKEQMEIARKRAEDEKRIKQEEAANQAEKKWASFLDASGNEYLKRKKLNGAHGTKMFRADVGTTLCVPTRDVIDGRLTGFQKISPDGSKRFCTGQRVDGCAHTIGDPTADEAFLCEGFATGVSIHMATGKTVYVAFSAHNLISVAKALILRNSSLRLIVCGDDDRFHASGNPGKEAAEKAAMMCAGAVVMPTFKPDSKGTDFNDVHCEDGLAAVTALLTAPPEATSGFIPLGYDTGTFFFFVVSVKDIIRVTSWSTVQLYCLAPASYWFEMYPSKTGVNWENAKDDLIQKCMKLGRFDMSKVRGAGVWLDRKRVVVNTGRSLVVDGEQLAMTAMKSEYLYISTKSMIRGIHDVPLPVAECQILSNICQSLKWQDPKSGYLLAGWLALARIAGALPIRPHVWVTGGSGTGKSTIMEALVRNALGSSNGKLYVQGGSTEAGVRQRVQGSSIPVIWDEFETNSEANKARVQVVVEMLRQAWSDSHGSVLKGSPTGSPEMYNLSFAAIVASIRVNLDNDADRSRFSVIELKPHGNDEEQWRSITKMLAKVDEEFGERLFARMITKVPLVISSYRTIGRAIACRVNKRYGQQTGMLLAGYWALNSDYEISEESAEVLVDSFDLTGVKDEILVNDEAECLHHLLTSKVTSRDSNGNLDKTVGEIVRGGIKWELDFLPTYGMMIIEEGLFIATQANELLKIYAKTRWTDWNKSLLRLPQTKRKHLRHSRLSARGLVISLEMLN